MDWIRIKELAGDIEYDLSRSEVQGAIAKDVVILRKRALKNAEALAKLLKPSVRES